MLTRRSMVRAVEAHPGHRSVSGGLARAAVFGMSDGLMSNVSLVIGFAGSGVAPDVVRLAGLAGAIAGAVSMGAGEWVSISAQNELIVRELAVEERELEHNPESELEELAVMYEQHGMRRETAEQAALEVTRSPLAALHAHAREELGVDPRQLPSAARAAILSFLCFIVGAMLPVVPFLVASGNGALVVAVGLGVAAAALLGWMIGRLAERRILWSSARQVLILLVGCALTYALGKLFDVSVS